MQPIVLGIRGDNLASSSSKAVHDEGIINPNFLKCILYYRSSHMEEGYPGNLECRTTYILNNRNELIIKFSAESDQDTIVNITNHNYWNFHGHQSYYQNIENHFVQMDAQFYLLLKHSFFHVILSRLRLR